MAALYSLEWWPSVALVWNPQSWPPSVHQLMGAPGWAGLPGGEVSEALASPAEFKGGAKKLSNRGN